MKIYLMCPFTHDDPKIMEERFVWSNRAAAYLMHKGYVVFSPISHAYPIAQLMPPDLMKDWQFWQKQDIPHLVEADEGRILMLDGWDISAGVAEETRLLRSLNKRIEPVLPQEVILWEKTWKQ